MTTRTEKHAFSDMTRLCASIMDGTEEILKRDDLAMIVVIKDEKNHEFGVATNAGKDVLPMLLMTLVRTVGGTAPAGQLLEMLRALPPPDGWN